MNREEFYNYILENYNISGEAARLVDNILLYIEMNCPEREQHNVLGYFLCTAIGISEKEISNVCL